MKKKLLVFALALTVATSMVAGTLAVYTQTIDEIHSKDVISKKFQVTSAGANYFKDEVKIAPTETVTKSFTVSNFDEEYITETDMETIVSVALTEGNGLEPNPNLEIVVEKKNANGSYETITGATIAQDRRSVEFKDTLSKNKKVTNEYQVTVSWPSKDDDITYQGPGYGNNLTVSVTGTQVVNDSTN